MSVIVNPDEEYRIPSRAQHNALIRKVWTMCITGAILVFVTTGATVLIMWQLGYDSKTIVNVSTIVFQVVLLPYGVGYVAPALATSLLKMALGVDMSRRALDVGEKSVKVLDKLDAAVESRLKRVDNLIALIEDAVSTTGKHPLSRKLDEFLSELRYIRVEISKTGGRKAELNAALDEGERIAALIRGEAVPCPTCGHDLRLVDNGKGASAVCDGCLLPTPP